MVEMNYFVVIIDIRVVINYINFLDHHRKNKYDITITVPPKQIKIPYGICKLNHLNELVKIEEKPTNEYLISAGLYLIHSKVFKLIPKNKSFDMDNLIDLEIKKKFKIGIFRINKFSWKDIGNWTDFNKIKL